MATRKIAKAGKLISKADQQAALLGRLFAEAGESLGNLSVAQEYDRDEVKAQVEQYVREAMANGLTCDKNAPEGDMLKAPSKANPGELWLAFVNALNLPRYVAYADRNGKELDDLTDEDKAEAGFPKSTRDNYLSAIRKFVNAKGLEPFDLYGNIAQAARIAKLKEAAKAPAKKGAQTVEVESHERKAPAAPAQVTDLGESALMGMAPLAAFLQRWVEANPTKNRSAEFKTIAEGAADLLAEAQAFTGKK